MNFRKLPLQRIGAWALAPAVPLLIFAVFLILNAGSSGTRVYLIEARSTGIRIEFTGMNNVWPLGRTIICTPLDRPDRTADRGDKLCDLRLFLQSEVDDLLLELSPKTKAVISTNFNGRLRISIKGNRNFPDNTNFLIDSDVWRSIGALNFTGYVRIGDQMVSGQQRYLLGGRYEVRESPKLPFGPSSRVDVIKTGQLLRGEQLSVETADGPLSVVGHLTPTVDSSGAMNIVVVSSAGNSFLRLGHIGGDGSSTIEPDWIDYALASPIVVALTLILTLSIGVGRLVFDTFSFLKSSIEKKKEVGANLSDAVTQENNLTKTAQTELSSEDLAADLSAYDEIKSDESI